MQALSRRWRTGVDGATAALLSFPSGAVASVAASFEGAAHEVLEVTGTYGRRCAPTCRSAAGADDEVDPANVTARVSAPGRPIPITRMLAAFATAAMAGADAHCRSRTPWPRPRCSTPSACGLARRLSAPVATTPNPQDDKPHGQVRRPVPASLTTSRASRSTTAPRTCRSRAAGPASQSPSVTRFRRRRAAPRRRTTSWPRSSGPPTRRWPRRCAARRAWPPPRTPWHGRAVRARPTMLLGWRLLERSLAHPGVAQGAGEAPAARALSDDGRRRSAPSACHQSGNRLQRLDDGVAVVVGQRLGDTSGSPAMRCTSTSASAL